MSNFTEDYSFRMHPDQEEKVNELVQKTEMSLSGVVRNALDHYLKEKHDFETERIIQ